MRVGNNPVSTSSPPNGNTGNAVCRYLSNPAGSNSPINVTCPWGMSGRYVSIQRVGASGAVYLTLCEVQVLGYMSQPPAPPPPTNGIIEVANGKGLTAFQSSDSSANTHAGRAVDGLMADPRSGYPYCSSTTSSSEPWW